MSFQKTWDILHDYVDGAFDNFSVFTCKATSSNRGGRPMGGITVLIKNEICHLVKRICNDFIFGVVLKIDKSVFNLDKDVVFMSVYLPPANSTIFDIIDSEYKGISSIENILITNNLFDHNILICGDFNARTGSENDFIENSNVVSELEEYVDLFNSQFDSPRTSSDNSVNKCGRELLDFCKTYGCYILNDRFGGSDYTFMNKNGCSVIDYFISSFNILHFVDKCEVLSMHESSHFPITLSVRTALVIHKVSGLEPTSQVKYVVNSSNNEEYLDSLANIFTPENCIFLHALIDDFNFCIDNIIDKIGSYI